MKKNENLTHEEMNHIRQSMKEYVELEMSMWEKMIKELNQEAHEKAVSEDYKGEFRAWSPEEGRKELVLFIYKDSGWHSDHIADLTRTPREFTHSVIFNFNWKYPELARQLAKKNRFV